MGLVVDVDLHEQDGLDYLEVTIVPSNVPVSYRGKYYYRSGSTLQELTGNCVDRFPDAQTEHHMGCCYGKIGNSR